MQYIVTKENWSSDPNNAPLPSDFNRIESNTRKVEENLQEETADRAANDGTLQTNINNEASTRAANDVTLQTNINNEASTRAANDGTLQTNINNEASTRAAADTAITSTLATLGAVYSYAMLLNSTGADIATGGTSNANYLRYSSAGGASGGNASGTWKCMGYCPNGTVSLFVKIS